MIFMAMDAHRTSGLDPAYARTRACLMIGRLHSLGFPGEQCLGGRAAFSPTHWRASAAQLPNPELYSLAKPQGLENHKLNLSV